MRSKNMMTIKGGLFAASLLVFLGGCGDVANDDDDTATAGAITQTNSERVATDVLTSTSVLFDTSSTTTVKNASGEDVSTRGGLASLVLGQFETSVVSDTGGARTVRATYSDTGVCPGGGEYAWSWNDVSRIYDVAYTNCVVMGVTYNGGYTLSSVIGYANLLTCPGDVSYTVTFNSLSMTDGTNTAVATGGYDYSLAREDRTDPIGCEYWTQTINGSALHNTINGIRVSLTAFNVVDQLDIGSGAYITDHGYTVTSSAAGGYVTVDTPTPVSGVAINDHPSAGVITVTDGTATLTITINSEVATDLTAVHIAYDADSDGTPEYEADYSWDALEAL